MKAINTSRVLILSSMLLLMCIYPPASDGQTQGQAENSTDKIFVGMLEKVVDVKRLKVGDTANLGGYIVLSSSNSSLMTVVARVVDVHRMGNGNKDSLLVIRFEKAILGNTQELPVYLRLQAIVAPSNLQWSFPLIIVDHYPCDSKANPGCDKNENKQEVPLSQLQRIASDENRKKASGQQSSGCVPLPESNGMYGFPDFSLVPRQADSNLTFAITSQKKNVRFEEGTYFVLSGHLPETLNTQP